jgi:hypothetical protein
MVNFPTRQRATLDLFFTNRLVALKVWQNVVASSVQPLLNASISALFHKWILRLIDLFLLAVALVMMWGDLNLPDINWTIQAIDGNSNAVAINHRLLDCTQNCGLEQMVNFPTRQRATCIHICPLPQVNFTTYRLVSPGSCTGYDVHHVMVCNSRGW